MGLDNPVGDVIVKLGSYLQPKGVGSYLRTHIGRVPRYDTIKIRGELGQPGAADRRRSDAPAEPALPAF
jgi:hypothetical protein